jgi:hypothetical protein
MRNLETPADYMHAYPRLTAHLICYSLGYCTPTSAARILMNAHHGEPNYCEWIASCYSGDARRAVQGAIHSRHTHHGYMADFDHAYRLVRRAIKTGDEPLLASWF